MKPKSLVAIVSVMAALVLATSPPTPAQAATYHMSGRISCANGQPVYGVYVVNSTSSARSGWANLWWNNQPHVQYYAYDGALSGDAVRVRASCDMDWKITYTSDSTWATSFHDLLCAKVGASYRVILS